MSTEHKYWIKQDAHDRDMFHLYKNIGRFKSAPMFHIASIHVDMLTDMLAESEPGTMDAIASDTSSEGYPVKITIEQI